MPRVSSPVVVGRHEELQRILYSVRADSTDHLPLIIVGGEAGVGKSRLVQEASRYIRESGSVVLSGGCINLVDAYPYAPFVEALRDLTSLLPEGSESSLRTGNEDVISFPFLAAHPTTIEPTAGLSYTSPQAGLFEGLLRSLVRLAQTSPLLLVIEDLHWADRSSLDLLSFLTRNVATKRLTLLATYRTDEVVRQHPLTSFLAELERSGRAERIFLGRLSRSEVGQLVAAIRGESPEPTLADQIYARSEGNPFFAEELLAAGAPTGRLPETLREVLLTRAASLSEGSREVLRVASASGRRVSGHLLATVSGIDESDLLPHLRESVSKQILRVDEARAVEENGYAFRHALMQEAVYADLLPAERTILHAKYARALGAVNEPASYVHSGELAHHWYAAHDLPRAFESSIRAGLEAESVFAFPEAQVHYERALELWDRVPEPEALGQIDRVALLESAARAAAVIDPSRAVAHITNAIQIMKPEFDRSRYGLLHEKLGLYRWEAGDSDGALSAYQQAVNLVPAQPPSLARAQALAGLAQVLMVIPRVEESRPIAEEAVRVARTVEAAGVECHALNTLGMDLGYMGDVETGLASLKRSLEMATDLNDVENGSRAYINLTDLLVQAGRLAEAAAIGAESSRFHEAHGLVYMWIFAVCESAVALYRLGRWDECAAVLGRAQQLPVSGVAEIFLQLRLAALDVGRGNFDQAEKRLDHSTRLSDQTPDTQWVAPLTEHRAELAIWRGRGDLARQVVSGGLGLLLVIRGSQLARQGPIYTLGIRAEADLAALARARRSQAEVRECHSIASGYLAQLQAVASDVANNQPAFAPLADGYLSLGSAEITRLEDRSEPTKWSQAADAWKGLNMRYAEAYARFRQAEALLQRQHDRRDAHESLVNAHDLARELDAAPLIGEIRELGRRSRLEFERSSESPGPALVDPARFFGLTPREREVLKGLAAGQTNRQIAEQLFISEKTASVHVSNILRKLSAASRTEAAAIAYRLNLVGP